MFLTIVTRTCQRPVMLGENIQSVKDQTCHDLEQVFIVDRQRKGIKSANKSLALNKDRVDGDYVYILDDDCMLTNPEFVGAIKDVVSEESWDIIMVKSTRPPGPPSRQPLVPTVWEGRLRHGSCNCLCYVIRAELWKEYIEWFGSKPRGGDWWFLSQVLGTAPSIYWLDEVMADARQLGRGKLFEDAPKGWFERVAEEHSLENLGEEDWRLRLWSSS